jgi:ribA/ribD-fused uncharacterized protein
MREGLRMKFTQNPYLGELLKSTDGYGLVECNPHDHFWGAGVSANNPKIVNRGWPGKNVMGKLLEELREELLHPNEVQGNTITYIY